MKELLTQSTKDNVRLLYTEKPTIPGQFGWQIRLDRNSIEYYELSEDSSRYDFFGSVKLEGDSLESEGYELSSQHQHIERIKTMLEICQCLKAIQKYMPENISEVKMLKDLTISYGINHNKMPFIKMYNRGDQSGCPPYLYCFMKDEQIRIKDDLHLTNEYIRDSLSEIKRELSQTTQKPASFVGKLGEKNEHMALRC